MNQITNNYHEENQYGFLRFNFFEDAYCFLLEKIKSQDIQQLPGNCIELFGIAYCIKTNTVPSTLINKLNIPFEWVEKELMERLSGVPQNPGTAWHKWEQYLRPKLISGKFHFTWSERIYFQLEKIVSILKENLYSRRAIISLWDPRVDLDSTAEVPSTIMAQFYFHNNSLNSIFYSRSSNSLLFLPADIYLFAGIQNWIAHQISLDAGNLSHVIGILYADIQELNALDKVHHNL
jgi:thymidylate synthase